LSFSSLKGFKRCFGHSITSQICVIPTSKYIQKQIYWKTIANSLSFQQISLTFPPMLPGIYYLPLYNQ